MKFECHGIFYGVSSKHLGPLILFRLKSDVFWIVDYESDNNSSGYGYKPEIFVKNTSTL